MNTNMTGFRCFLKNLCIPVLWTKVASALEGLTKHPCKFLVARDRYLYSIRY